ncbi:YdcF family protein [Bacillus sp. DNRA2]|uniref:YdcF family protein n=1 Tax=Bacillus sp. DNRA2 TaxID=2723053 RepID=UPI00145EA660|nr:YdcF family protein [Bacillus sp. DNRA2]NMD70160.1 YdcF family protein [Bacillus sp. DNRA2]
MSKKLIAIILIVVVIVLFIFGFAGRFLVIDEKPKKSAAIIVLTGGGSDRLERAVQLYNYTKAQYLIISNGTEDNYYQEALLMGVPNQSIILENQADSTTDSAVLTIDIMEKHRLKSAIVVSSNYHMRRVKHNFDKIIGDKNITLTYCASKDKYYRPNKWWASGDAVNLTFNEYSKLIGNALGIHGDTAKEILNTIE